MKPLWAQTLAWIAATAVALLLALATPDSGGPAWTDLVPQGSEAPR